MENNKGVKNYYFNRFTVRVYSFAVAVMLIGIGFFAVSINERRKSERETAAVYSRAFSGFTPSVLQAV